MPDDACAKLDEPTLTVAQDGSPLYDIKDFPGIENDAVLTVVRDLAERLHEAVVRVQMANREGDPILSAWLPDARAALTEAWRWCSIYRTEQGGAS